MIDIHLDGAELATASTSSKPTGFVGIGTSSFIRAAFDGLLISDGTN